MRQHLQALAQVPPTSKTTNGESVLPSTSKVKVAGAHRIWGTLRKCTVKSAIFFVCKIDRGVHVKCKVKKNLSLIRTGGGLYSMAVKACYVNLRKSGPRRTCKPPGSLSHVASLLPPPPLALCVQ